MVFQERRNEGMDVAMSVVFGCVLSIMVVFSVVWNWPHRPLLFLTKRRNKNTPTKPKKHSNTSTNSKQFHNIVVMGPNASDQTLPLQPAHGIISVLISQHSLKPSGGGGGRQVDLTQPIHHSNSRDSNRPSSTQTIRTVSDVLFSHRSAKSISRNDSHSSQKRNSYSSSATSNIARSYFVQEDIDEVRMMAGINEPETELSVYINIPPAPSVSPPPPPPLPPSSPFDSPNFLSVPSKASASPSKRHLESPVIPEPMFTMPSNTMVRSGSTPERSRSGVFEAPTLTMASGDTPAWLDAVKSRRDSTPQKPQEPGNNLTLKSQMDEIVVAKNTHLLQPIQNRFLSEVHSDTEDVPKMRDLRLLLERPEHVESLRAFFSRTYCCENLLFWEAVQEAKRHPSVELVNNIYHDFIDEEGSGVVNISGTTQTRLTKCVMAMNALHMPSPGLNRFATMSAPVFSSNNVHTDTETGTLLDSSFLTASPSIASEEVTTIGGGGVPLDVLAALTIAQAEVFELMQKDLMPRFLKHDLSIPWRNECKGFSPMVNGRASADLTAVIGGRFDKAGSRDEWRNSLPWKRRHSLT